MSSPLIFESTSTIFSPVSLFFDSILILLLIISILIIAASYFFQEKLSQFSSLGLLGIFLINLLWSATIFLPAPAIITVIAGGIIYSPFLVALVATFGATLGDLLGFLLGISGKNVFLKSFNPERVNFDKLKSLIGDLYLIHGNDSSDKGKFTNKDKEEYKDPEFNMLFGRSWTDYPKYKYPVSVSRDEDEISISIWGVDK